MPFIKTDVNYAAEYSQALAQAYPYLSYFGDIWASENSNRYKAGMGKTMYIPTVSVKGARDVNRNSIDGSFSRNWNNDYQAVELQMDREWDTLIDPLDIQETNDVAALANITRAFVEMQKVPEMDAFLASKLAGFASAFGGVSTQSLTSSSILTEWDNAVAYMTDQRVNRDRCVSYMTPATYKLLKQATGITRFLEVSNGIQAADRNIARLDGIRVVEVPADMMKTAYSFTEGWEISGSAAQINFMIVDPMAIAAPIKYETAMVSAPTAQSKGKYLYYERYYYGAFALNQRQAGIYAHLSAAPSAGELTITSVAGTVDNGDTVITAAGYGIHGNSVDEGLKLMYTANNAGAATITYGAVPDAGKTWAVMGSNPITLKSMTASNHVSVVVVNKETGFVVAGGDTTMVVKA